MPTVYQNTFAKCMEIFRFIQLFVERTQLNRSRNIVKVHRNII